MMGHWGRLYILAIKFEFSKGTTNNISASFYQKKKSDSILAQQEKFILLKHPSCIPGT